MDFKKFYEWYHRDRRLPKRIINNKNFTYRNIIYVLDKFCTKSEILDVGSGVGTLDFYLAKKGNKITGIEISEKAYKVAIKSQKLFGLESRIKFIRSDFFKSKIIRKFGFVICSEVLEHLPDDLLALKKISRVTKKGGLLFFSVPSPNAPLNIFNSIEEFDKRSGHLRRYTVDDAKTLLKKAGFETIYFKKSEGVLRNALFVYPLAGYIVRIANRFSVISDMISVIDNILLKIFGESQIILIGRKNN